MVIKLIVQLVSLNWTRTSIWMKKPKKIAGDAIWSQIKERFPTQMSGRQSTLEIEMNMIMTECWPFLRPTNFDFRMRWFLCRADELKLKNKEIGKLLRHSHERCKRSRPYVT